jgi:hypothetical protein
MNKEELIEHLNDNYSTLDVDEARHFVNKHYTPDITSEQIATKENLMEITNE